jgi:hypothetical protein
LLLGCGFNDARAWVRALETFEPVARDARCARLVTLAQLERIAAARLIASTRDLSRIEAIKFVGQLDRALETLQWLDASREVMGVTALEARVTVLEKKLGDR